MSNPNARRPMEILLVEDSLSDARVTLESLKPVRPQHRLTLVRDGAEALEFLYQEGRFVRTPRPDLILLDLGLPKVDGREVLSQIKADFDLNAIPVIVLTASRLHEDRVRSEFLQVDAYMTKPVQLEAYVTIVNELRPCLDEDVIVPVL